ncbi:unnamed protein product [Adineta steineri]|uniref:Uncharacterized protein n=1 Tax=Adineta steineri TaxID=433720 RepID=A0A819ZS57_9BILA|nr:unnamed protein product [Adineta steineri]
MKREKTNFQAAEPVLINIKTLDDTITWAENESTVSQKINGTSTKKFLMINIYRFADAFDICLLIIGTISSLASGACFPLLLLIYQQVTDALVNYGKLQYIEQNNLQNLSQLSCENGGFDIPDNTTSPIQAIENVVKWYVILGFSSIFFYMIGFSAYMVSAERQIRRIRFRLFHNILYQDMSYFDVLGGKGKLSNMLTDDLLKIKDGIGDKVADFLSLLARMIGCLIFALTKGWKLTLVILAVAPLVIIAFNLTIKLTIKYTRKQIQAYAEANTIAQEVLTAIRTVTAFSGHKKEYARYKDSLSELPSIGIKKGIIQGSCQIFSNFAIGIVFAAALWYGQYLIKTECQTYSAGVLVVKSKIDASKIDEGEKPFSFKGEIKFENVTFTYPARREQPILKNLNITIPSGKRVALVGHSGCGKSTTLGLIPRLYDPDIGQVLLDGKDIRTLNIKWFRSNIGYVGQEPVLFSGSIKDNIRLGKPDATDIEIYEAAKMANAHEFILKLPDRYNASAKGKLSGGQKQRIAIARAIISNPKLLILDEATSALGIKLNLFLTII